MGGRGVSPWQSAKTLKVDGLKRAQMINMSVKQEDYQIWTNGYMYVYDVTCFCFSDSL